MKKNPYLNAVLAAAYIVLLVSGAFLTQSLEVKKPNILIPISMLSLFVLSAAIMGFLFVLQPAMMCIDGKRKEGVNFFVKTTATFAGICVLFFIALALAASW